MLKPAPAWFAIAIIIMAASQIARLQQHDPEYWIACDYAGRLGALTFLAAIPSARAIAFGREKRHMALWKLSFWIVAIVIANHLLDRWVVISVSGLLPATVLGTYPHTVGWLYWIDTVFGLALVAYSEEVLFRRCARHVFKTYLGDGYVLVVVTSVLFGAYHWWSGAGNVIAAALIGGLLMVFYQRCGALWPAILAHYLTDIVVFA
jgi:membrane protease YdiL (CAAX protease family)